MKANKKKMIKILILTLSVTIVVSKKIDIESEWAEFKNDYKKIYKSFEEAQFRKSVWLENLKFVESFELSNPNATFKVQINEMSDRRIKASLT